MCHNVKFHPYKFDLHLNKIEGATSQVLERIPKFHHLQSVSQDTCMYICTLDHVSHYLFHVNILYYIWVAS